MPGRSTSSTMSPPSSSFGAEQVDSDARPVADPGRGAGDAVEERGFAGVRHAHQGDAFHSGERLNLYFLRFFSAQHDVGSADADMQRAGKAAMADDFDAFADAEAQRRKAIGKRAIGMHRRDSGGFTGFESFQVDGSHAYLDFV